MQPGDTISLVVQRQTSAGVASAGKVLADFTIRSYKNGVYYDASATITEIETTGSWTTYKLAVTLNTGGPYWNHVIVQPASGTDVIAPNFFSGEVEAQDIDSMFANVVRPTIRLAQTNTVPGETQLSGIAYRENVITASITDAAGAAIDLSGYNNWKFGVWDKTHTGSILYALSSGITGSNLGVVTFNIPEGAGFYSQIASAFTAGVDSVTLYYDVIADAASDATKTRTIMRGQFILYRYETA